MFLTASTITPRPISWLWPGRLALGKLSLLEGDPGQGKSSLTVDLCARLTTGAAWPDGAPLPAPASVVLLNAEDDPEDILVPRLIAAGADCSRVCLWSVKAALAGDRPSTPHNAATPPASVSPAGLPAALRTDTLVLP